MVSKRKQTSKLGHDPLAWISEDDIKEIQDENNIQVDRHQEIETQEEEPVSEELVVTEISDDETLNMDSKMTDECEKEEKVDKMLELPVYFGIAQVADIYIQMQSHFQGNQQTIEIIGEEVESIDAAAIQLLVAFVLKARQENKTIIWKGISSRLDDALEVMNIKNNLDIAA